MRSMGSPSKEAYGDIQRSGLEFGYSTLRIQGPK